jgi:beta-galactosidase
VGRYPDGRIAAVERQVGKGRVLLIGTFPGAGYFLHHHSGTREFFASLLSWAGIHQIAAVDDAQVKARVHSGTGGTYLWVVNPTRQPRTVKVMLSTKTGAPSKALDLWQQNSVAKVDGATVSVRVEDRNAAVLKLE